MIFGRESQFFQKEYQLIFSLLGEKPVHPAWITDIDASGFISICRRHRIEALVLSKAREKAVVFPSEVEELLESGRLKTMQRHMRMIQELFWIKKILDEAAIRYLLLKGPAIAYAYYDEPFARSFSDLDILIDPTQFDYALQQIRQQGYVYKYAREASQGKRFRNFRKVYPHVTLIHPDHGIALELHYRLFTFEPLEYGSFETLFLRKGFVQISGMSFACLHPEDHLHFAAVHGLLHGWYQLIWLYDVHTMARANAQSEEFTDQRGPLPASAVQFASFLFSEMLEDLPEKIRKDSMFRLQYRFALKTIQTMQVGQLKKPLFQIQRGFFFKKIFSMAGIPMRYYPCYLAKKVIIRIGS